VRSIRKGPEPDSLARHRDSGHSDYDNFLDKDTLRKSLIGEQGGLCCYCLSRIEVKNAKIEHWHSQSEHPLEQLDYSNLLAACKGNEGERWSEQHCDTRKGNSSLSRNPANPSHRVEDTLHFKGDGRIVSDDPGFDAELNHVLNLNYSRLKENRKAVLEAFCAQLRKRGELQRRQLESMLREWNEVSKSDELPGGELREFCQVVVYWLRKRIARL
jgi:uncharacterized protein (TIGR02646 family)